MTIFLLFIAFSFFLPASPALAVQQHGGIEGLVAHEIGHLLFIGGMVFMLAKIHSFDGQSVGWRSFKGFLWLICAWNILTFFGHWQMHLMDADKFVRVQNSVVAFKADGAGDLLFYLSRLDHLLLIPAFFYLSRAINQWRSSS